MIFFVYLQERDDNNDLVYIPSIESSKDFFNFSHRLLYMFRYFALQKDYTFDFFLRVDDDYFVCLQRLLYELPFRISTRPLVWGWMHCAKGV